MKEFIRKNWKEILLCLVVLLFFQKCTQSCNRLNEIEYQTDKIGALNNIITIKDSTIHDLTLQNKNLEELLNSEKNHNSNYTDIATYNQKELLNKIDILTKENNSLKKENIFLKKTLENTNK